jgi:hypothetical protein
MHRFANAHDVRNNSPGMQIKGLRFQPVSIWRWTSEMLFRPSQIIANFRAGMADTGVIGTDVRYIGDIFISGWLFGSVMNRLLWPRAAALIALFMYVACLSGFAFETTVRSISCGSCRRTGHFSIHIHPVVVPLEIVDVIPANTVDLRFR